MNAERTDPRREELATLRALGREATFRGFRIRTPDGLSIAVQDWRRPASGRDVLLMHGYVQSHLSWLKQVSGTLAEEFRLLTYDLRGHGQSEKPLEANFYRDPERWAAELETVIREAGLVRPVLVCWSYAGRVVLDYLKCRGDANISGAVFVNATSKAGDGVMGSAAAVLRPSASDDPASNIEAATALLRACTARPLPEEELRYMLAFNLLVPHAVRKHLSGREADYQATLSALRVPVLAIHGREDAINLPAMAQYTCATAPHGRLIEYAGCGHMPFWERSESFDRDLGHFLRNLD